MKRANYDVYEYLLQMRGIKTSDVCKATGVDPSTISTWQKGNNVPKNDKLEKLAEYFGILPWDFFCESSNLENYFTGKRIAYSNSEPYEVAAGNGRINDDFGTGEYSDVRICGDSMYPALHDGDIVRFHHVTENISPKDFAIVKINGDESTCKHIEITNDGIWLKAENKDVFSDKFYTIHDVLTIPVTIIGIATEIISRKL